MLPATMVSVRVAGPYRGAAWAAVVGQTAAAEAADGVAADGAVGQGRPLPVNCTTPPP